MGLLLGHWRGHGFRGVSPSVEVSVANACPECSGWGTRVMVLSTGRAAEVPCEPCGGTGAPVEIEVAV